MREHYLLDTLSLYAKIISPVCEIWRHLEVTTMAANKEVDIFKTASTLSSVQMFAVIDILRNWDKTLLVNMVTDHFISHGGGPMSMYRNMLQPFTF